LSTYCGEGRKHDQRKAGGGSGLQKKKTGGESKKVSAAPETSCIGGGQVGFGGPMGNQGGRRLVWSGVWVYKRRTRHEKTLMRMGGAGQVVGKKIVKLNGGQPISMEPRSSHEPSYTPWEVERRASNRKKACGLGIERRSH